MKTFKSLLTLATAALLWPGLALGADAASPEHVRIAPDHPVSASEARRIVRRYLATQGYSRAIGPGGASIRGVQLDVDHWVVDVTLRGAAATSVKPFAVYVHTGTGMLSQATANR